MLIFEPGDKEIMKRRPRDPKMPMLSMEMVWQMLVVGSYMLAASYAMFNYALSSGYSEEYARTVAVNIFVFIELFYLFNCKELQRSVFKTNIFNNSYLLIGVTLMALIQISFTHLEFMNTIFKSQPLDISTWLQIIIIAIGVMFVVEIKRYLERKILNA
jgi:Ca2+-transporting ATPase